MMSGLGWDDPVGWGWLDCLGTGIFQKHLHSDASWAVRTGKQPSFPKLRLAQHGGYSGGAGTPKGDGQRLLRETGGSCKVSSDTRGSRAHGVSPLQWPLKAAKFPAGHQTPC